VAAQLQAGGMQEVDVHPAPAAWWKRLFGKREWACVAETHAILSEAAVFATTDNLNALATQHGGTYDGWEAGIVQ
jgi:hypothetical protein